MTADRRPPPTLYPGGVLICEAGRSLAFPDDELRDLVEGWRTARVGRYLVRYDETWRANQAAAGDAEVLLLGTAMDLDDPRASQQAIVESLAAALGVSDGAFLDRIDALVGAHILVVRRGETSWVLSDATAMEALAYDTGGDETLVASYPALVAELRGYEMSEIGKLWMPTDPRPEAQKWRFWAGSWHLPGVSTQYAQVRALTPNTRLELGSRRVERFFPRAPIGELDMDVIVERVAGHLRDAYAWVAREFPGGTSVSLSGGLDSRLSLAASREVADQLEYFTYYYSNHPVHRHDLRAAETLADRLRLNHTSWPLRFSTTREGLPEAWERMHHGIHGSGRTEFSYAQRLPVGNLHVRANVLEVVRGYFVKNPALREDKWDVARLSRIFRMATGEYFRPQYEEFMEVTGFSNEAKQDMHFSDLYHWEQRLGRWHSEVVRRSKVAHNTFIIWNARRILTMMLARPDEDRWKAKVVYRLIDRLWPDVLETPIFSGREFAAPAADIPAGPPAFSWERLAPEIRRSFARALELDASDGETAARALAERMPAPAAADFADERLLEAALSGWLIVDPAALEHVYGQYMLTPRSQWPPSAADRVRDIGRRRARPAGEPLRRMLAAALLLAGGRLPPIPDRAALRPYLRVPTTRFNVDPLEAHEEQLLASLRSGDGAGGLVELAPGGGGRRVVARGLLADHVRQGRRILWITQRVELLEQAALAFVNGAALLRERTEPLVLRVAGGAYGPRELSGLAGEGPDVLLATVAALARNPAELEAFLHDHDVVVIVEHAQHVAAPAWQELVERVSPRARAVIGLVTAGGGDGAAAAGTVIAGEVLARQDLDELIAAGAVAAPRPLQVDTGVAGDAGLSAQELGDLASGELAAPVAKRLAEAEDRDALIVETWREGHAERRYRTAIVLALDPPHARALVERFQAAGARVDWLSPRRENRQHVIDRFRRPELDVLVTADPLAEGIDAPLVDAVLVARPIRSPALLAELCAAALRGPAAGGSPEAHLVTFADRWQELTGWIEARTLFPGPPAGAGEDAVSAAVYEFDAVIALGDGETEVRRHRIAVLEHQLEGYDALERAVAAGPSGLPGSGFELRERFFGATAEPLPAAQDLVLLAAYAAAHGGLPPRVGTP